MNSFLQQLQTHIFNYQAFMCEFICEFTGFDNTSYKHVFTLFINMYLCLNRRGPKCSWLLTSIRTQTQPYTHTVLTLNFKSHTYFAYSRLCPVGNTTDTYEGIYYFQPLHSLRFRGDARRDARRWRRITVLRTSTLRAEGLEKAPEGSRSHSQAFLKFSRPHFLKGLPIQAVEPIVLVSVFSYYFRCYVD